MHKDRLQLSSGFLLSAAFALAACGPTGPAQHYGYLALLGRDTVSIENVTRTGNTIVSDEMDKFPRVRRRHTVITVAADGSIRRLEMDIRTPSEPSPQRLRHVLVTVDKDSVHIRKTDSSGTRQQAFATGGALAMGQLEQMYSLNDLYFAAAFARKPPTDTATVKLRQFYIDREFDRFPLGHGTVRFRQDGKALLDHDWLSGTAVATFDSLHHMLTYSGAGTTYKVEVKRLTDSLPDVEAIGERFAAAEAKTGAAQLSVRDTARGVIGRDTLFVDYGRPLTRGRVLLGNIITYGDVWRTGANAATQFHTSAPITVGGLKLSPGMYTLWTVPTEKDVQLIVNTESGQWGTEYNPAHDVGKVAMKSSATAAPVEKFTITIVPIDAKHGTLVMEWGPFRWEVGIGVL